MALVSSSKLFLVVLISCVFLDGFNFQDVPAADITQDKPCGDRKGYDKNCIKWSESGYCSSNSIYGFFTQLNCQKTCRLCNLKPFIGCKDMRPGCPGWVYYCKPGPENIWSNFMKKYCPETCRLCS